LQVARPRLDLWRLLRPGGLLEGDGIVDRLLGSVGWSWLLDTRVQRRAVARVLGGDAPFTPRIDLAVSAVDIADGTARTFVSRVPELAPDHADYEVLEQFRLEHLLASAAVPLLFTPVEVDGRHYWDGGVIANTPLSPAIHLGATRLLVVKTIQVARPARARTSLGHSAAVLVDTLFDHVLRTDLKLAGARNRLDGFRHVEWKIIEPERDQLRPHIGLDFGTARTDELIASGRRAAAQALDGQPWADDHPAPAQG
jgi:predicted acylesterase/phospholipase RssA